MSLTCATPVPTGQVGSRVYLFNPFSEGSLAYGKAYTPVKHQTQMAADLANLPQFLCLPEDLVLVPQRPAADFLNALQRAGFNVPEFVVIESGCRMPENPLWQCTIVGVRPWAWGPDSVAILAPFWERQDAETQCEFALFQANIAQLYSKAWSAKFLRKILSKIVTRPLGSALKNQGATAANALAAESWLCSESEAGVAVASHEEAMAAIVAIRARGHHRIAVKEAIGLAGHNAIRLWEPEILAAQRKWLAQALDDGRQLVVEPWLEREMDFSIQLEMTANGLEICGFTGLINDLKGQFQANWAETDYAQYVPSRVATLLCPDTDITKPLHAFYREVFTMLEAELRLLHFIGPISMDAFIYRAPDGTRRLKPVVEINPRYTMGRLTLEIMKSVGHGSCGVFRLRNKNQIRAAGFSEFSLYAKTFMTNDPPIFEEGEPSKIRQGSWCLNDPALAQACLATFTVKPAPRGCDFFADNKF